MRRWSSIFVLVAAATACGGGTAENQVRMLDNTFSPEVLEVTAGAEVVFVNDGRVDHNAIADDNAFDTQRAAGRNQTPGESWPVTIDRPGTYPYYCSLHAVQDDDGEWQGMVGILRVTDGTP